MPSVKALREEVALAKARLNSAREEVALQKRLLAEAKSALKMEVGFNKRAKAAVKADAAAARAAKKADRIAKLEAKLLAMKSPVGVKAIRAARRPSKPVVMSMAA